MYHSSHIDLLKCKIYIKRGVIAWKSNSILLPFSHLYPIKFGSNDQHFYRYLDIFEIFVKWFKNFKKFDQNVKSNYLIIFLHYWEQQWLWSLVYRLIYYNNQYTYQCEYYTWEYHKTSPKVGYQNQADYKYTRWSQPQVSVKFSSNHLNEEITLN